MTIASTKAVSAFTGMPSGKSHRGKRSRGKKANPSGLGQGKQVQHFEALKGAMASGDHASAKVSALHLANALHSLGKKGKSSVPSPAAASMKPAPVTDGQPVFQGTGDTV
jgi:hypothetical protein